MRGELGLVSGVAAGWLMSEDEMGVENVLVLGVGWGVGSVATVFETRLIHRLRVAFHMGVDWCRVDVPREVSDDAWAHNR